MATTRPNYALMMRCEGNPDIAKWVEAQNLTSALDNLTVKTDELNKGLHLTLLFIGGDMHALATNQSEFAKLTAEIDSIFNEHKAQLFKPLMVDSAAIFGEFQHVIVLKLRQEGDILKAINELLKKKLTEQYNVKVGSQFPFSAHVSIAERAISADDLKTLRDKTVSEEAKAPLKAKYKIPEEVITKINAELSNKTLQNGELKMVNKVDLSRRDGFGPTAPTAIVYAYRADVALENQVSNTDAPVNRPVFG
jgi:hypothetical protein